MQAATRMKSDFLNLFVGFFFVFPFFQFFFSHSYCAVSCYYQSFIYSPTDALAVPLQARSVPEGSRKLSFPDYMTTAQDGGKFISLTHRPPLPLVLLVLISVRG